MAPDDDADLEALFDQTAAAPTQEQRERWARHAATLPDRPRRRWWWWLPVVPAAAAVAFALWPKDPQTLAHDLDLSPSGAPAAIGPVPADELGGLDLLIAAADDTAPLESDDPEPESKGPPRIRLTTRDPLAMFDGLGDPVAPLELLGPPPRAQVERQLEAFASLLEKER